MPGEYGEVLAAAISALTVERYLQQGILLIPLRPGVCANTVSMEEP